MTFYVDVSARHISWDPVQEADYYEVYHDDDDDCDSPSVLELLGAAGCRRVESRVVESTYLHTSPIGDYYWVKACNIGGCSELSASAVFIDKSPPGPTNVVHTYTEGTRTSRISWEPVEEAEYYNVYVSKSVFADYCEITPLGGIPTDRFRNCELVQQNMTETYLDVENDGDDELFVASCGRGGCSDPVMAVRR